MSVRRDVIRVCRISPILLLLVGCHDCSDPWEEPEPPTVAYLSVVPFELHVYVPDPRRVTTANLMALVHDVYGRNVDDQQIRFAVTAGGPLFSASSLSAKGDSAALSIAPACLPEPSVCAPEPVTAEITVTHDASKLEVKTNVHVRYEALGDHGVSTPYPTPWPAYGIGSGEHGGAWIRSLRPFIHRVGFAKYDASPDDPGGMQEAVVLSHASLLWRRTSPWGATPGDVVVPPDATAKPASVPITAYYAGDPAFADATREPMLLGLQAGADILNYTPAGVLATVEVGNAVGRIEWTAHCVTLAGRLLALEQENWPTEGRVTVYMMAPSASAGGDFAVRCGPKDMPTGPLEGTHVIVLPYGSVMPSRFAHELGHVLGLDDVTVGSGFFGDNLMMQTDAVSARMRSRLTIGQAYRAALDPSSFVARSRPPASGTVDCSAATSQCSAVVEDVTGRVP